MSRRAIVVGGGVIGAACAHYLNLTDWDVTVVERKEFGSGAAHANCGLISPSHVLPIPQPGVIAKSLKGMLFPNSPFAIKPRLDIALWSWLFQFARHCNQRDMLESGETLQRMLNSSRLLYDELIANESLDVEWQTEGVLFPFLHQDGMEHFAETDRLLREHFGLGAVRYDGAELSKLEPALKPELAGGWHYTADAHLKPDKLMSAWKVRLEERGVTIREHHEFLGFGEPAPHNGSSSSHGATRVVTSKGEFEADAFVVATGAWTPLLNQSLGCRVPIQPGKGYSMTMARPKICPKIPMIFEEHRVAVTPWPSGYRLGSIMEFAGYDATLDPKKMAMLRAGAAHYLHEPSAEPVVEEWFGWRPMTPDSLPIIDRCPNFNNVYLAAGHNMLGVSMAPVTGKLIAEMMNGQTPHVPIEPMSLKRF
ncbi:NAD(P)/FAD-dependent oxidoreductase [Schlesneria paludicola]|uniref:NAD(P)/FAD-dependent oxidoreductase n=1 Tax=Schlesneria paludicola TaxID=360056 RepID=UPI00029AF374|nr:FAD-dependent oxidoreductase [Schlesneria paludicola]